MKSMFAASLIAFIVTAFQRPLAQAINVDPLLTGWSEFGAVSMLGTIVMVLLLRVMPQQSKDSREALVETARINADAIKSAAETNAAAKKEMATQLSVVHAAITKGNEDHLDLLRQILIRTQGNS